MPTNIELWEQAISTPTQAYKNMLEAEHKFLLDNIPNGSEILDVGCGEGRNIRSILEKTDHVTGLDKDAAAVQSARKNLEKFPHVKIVVAEAARMPFDDESFDVVTIIGLLENLDNDKIKVLTECCRVLKHEGKTILMAYNEDAFEERMKIYKQINASIKKIEGTKVIFEGSITSEQYSPAQIQELTAFAGFKLMSCEKQGIINICILKKA